MKRSSTCFFGVIVLCSCPASQPSEKAFDRAAMLANIADEVAIPRYVTLRDRTAALGNAVAAMCAAPSTQTVTAAEAAWLDAYLSYKATEAVALGPATDLRLPAAIDSYPVKTAEVDAFAAGGMVTTPEAVDALGTAGKGLPVAEYLIFDDSVAIANRCAYLSAVVAHVAQKTSAVADAWSDGFAAELAEPTTAFRSLAAAIDAVLNQIATAAKSASEMQVLKPAGKKDGGTPQPQAVDARFSGQSKAALLATLDGIEAAYRGADDKGLVAFVRYADAKRSTRVAEDVLDAIAAAKAAVNAVPGTLEAAVVASPTEVNALIDALRELFEVLSTDVASLLGVSLTFSDADGD